MFCIYSANSCQEIIQNSLIQYLKDGNLKNLNYMDENGNYKSYYDDIYLKMEADPL